jgi:hypothetical protein
LTHTYLFFICFSFFWSFSLLSLSPKFIYAIDNISPNLRSFICTFVFLLLYYWSCLLSTEMVQDSAWHYSLHFFSVSFFLTTIHIKTFPFFFTFYITSIIFLLLSNKKFTKIQIFFLLFYTNSFYFISHHHFLLILKLTTSLLYSVLVFVKQPH